jgi:iron only hydrogenase large subunit-like protein
MNKQQPIFTERAECQDCYKCVRSCPVKAIKIEQGVASVMEDLCIYCGTCVDICPAGAKRVRNDRRRVQHLLETNPFVIVSLAPSWLSEFHEIPSGAFIRALKTLGFHGVSETALGAQEVSAHTARLLSGPVQKCWFSSACPVVVEYMRKYRPEQLDHLTGLSSPVIAHGRMLKQLYGDQCQIVFISPCIAKKHEIDTHANLIAAALTFEDLRLWFQEAGIDLTSLSWTAEDYFIPYPAEEGGLYPIDGGMIAGIKANCSIHDARCMSLSGIENVMDTLQSLAAVEFPESLFIELLACQGGCINGPKTLQRHATIPKR